MPEFWEDERSVEEFTSSFGDYLEYRIQKDANSKRPRRMIQHMCERFGLSVDDQAADIRKKIESFFGVGGRWPITDWPGVSLELEPDGDD